MIHVNHFGRLLPHLSMCPLKVDLPGMWRMCLIPINWRVDALVVIYPIHPRTLGTCLAT